MQHRLEIAAAFASTLFLSVAFGALPALSSVLTSPDGFGLGPTQYGVLFLPQAFGAILASLAEAIVARRVGPKALLLAGVVAAFGAFLLLSLSQLLIGDTTLVFVVLLAASGLIGTAFGFGVPAGISLVGGYFPTRRDRAILYLNGMVAFGPGIAPVLAALAVSLGAWWLMPLLFVVILGIDVLVAARLPFALPAAGPSLTNVPPNARPWRVRDLPQRFWLYCAFSLLYGIVQTLNGNWAALFMSQDIGATAAQAGFALTIFWVALGVGRIVFGSLDRIVPETAFFQVLPFVASGAFVLLALTPDGDVALAFFAFALTGLGCSVLLPLAVSFSQAELVTLLSMMASALIASYMIGFGIASFAVGPLVEQVGMDPSLIYAGAAVFSVVLGVMAIFLVRGLVASRSAAPSGPDPAAGT